MKISYKKVTFAVKFQQGKVKYIIIYKKSDVARKKFNYIRQGEKRQKKNLHNEVETTIQKWFKDLCISYYQQEIRNFHHISPTRHEDIQGLKGSNFVMPSSSSSFRKKFHSFQAIMNICQNMWWFFCSQFTTKTSFTK